MSAWKGPLVHRHNQQEVTLLIVAWPGALYKSLDHSNDEEVGQEPQEEVSCQISGEGAQLRQAEHAERQRQPDEPVAAVLQPHPDISGDPVADIHEGPPGGCCVPLLQHLFVVIDYDEHHLRRRLHSSCVANFFR